MALQKRAKLLPTPQRDAVERAVAVMTPPFLLSRKMLAQASLNNLNNPPEMVVVIAGYLDEVRVHSQHQILVFADPRFSLGEHPENTRHNELWTRAEQIDLRLILDPHSTKSVAESQLELLPDGKFSWAHTELLGEPNSETACGVADCILRTVSVALHSTYGIAV